MGKRIDELRLDNTPLDQAPDPRPTGWYRFSEVIDELIATGQVGWAEGTLRAIQTTVEQTERVTPGQQQAVANIEQAGREKRPSRRYEGYGRRGR